MLQTMKTDIYFPNLGLAFRRLGNGITVFGFDIMYYGMIIVCGMLFGVLLACWRAKRAGEQPDMIIDFALYAIVAAVIGARIYYVVFAWDSFRDNPLSVFNLRTGGLAIYGGIIGGVLMAAVYARIRKISFCRLTDICAPALLLGQVIGRLGNFFNREAFGAYTDGLFAMQLDRRAAGSDFSCSVAALEQRYAGREEALSRILEIRNNAVWINGVEYIQVHPTFLYEMAWNAVLLLLLLLYTKHRAFEGEITLLYLAGYGLGRVFIEGLRTDQLFLWGSHIAVSQLLSALLVVLAAAMIAAGRLKLRERFSRRGRTKTG